MITEAAPPLFDPRCQALLAALPRAIALVRPSDLTILYANPRCLELLGADFTAPGPLPAGPDGATPMAAMVPDIRRQLAASGESVFEATRRRTDGTARWIRHAITRIDDPELGELWLLTLDDLSAQRRSEHALRESQHRFDALWHSGMIGLAISDPRGTILDANDTYLAMLDHDRAAIDARSLTYAGLTPPEDHPTIAAKTRELEARGFAEPWETETIRRGGARLPIMVGVAMIDERTNLAIIADRSAHKRAEDNLRRTEEQLRHAQKMEAIGRLAGGVAHDFNNLLSIVLAYPRLILDGLDPLDPLRPDLEEILKAGTRAAELTKRLLLFSRQQVVEPKVVDLNQLLVGVNRMVQRLIGEDIELVSAPAADLGQVLVDPGNLEQVVMNLAVNARDAMPTGGRLTVETANVVLGADTIGVAPGRYVLLAVSDTGCGMDAATRARIFEPFFTTKTAGKGTGLGLSIVFGIVQQSGGHIEVESQVGRGTTFRIYLPRVDAKAEDLTITDSHATLHGCETVLLAEDEDQVRAAACTILRHYGYHVIEARNAGEALLLCEQHAGPIDLLLSDVVMPGMSGPELARRLLRSRPTMRVLCMSGYADDSLARHGGGDKGMAFLQKPLAPDALARKLREVLDHPVEGAA